MDIQMVKIFAQFPNLWLFFLFVLILFSFTLSVVSIIQL